MESAFHNRRLMPGMVEDHDARFSLKGAGEQQSL